MKRTFFATILLTLIFSAAALLSIAGTGGYKISIKLQNNSDTALLLAHYMGSKQYLDDTAYKKKNGLFIFEGNEPLIEGMYLVAGNNKTKYFDMFISGEQHFELSCDPMKVTETMQFKNSPENTTFYNYINFLGKKQKEIEPWRKTLFSKNAPADSVKMAKDKTASIDDEVKKYIDNFSNSGSFPANFVKANAEPDIMSFVKKADGSIDSSKLYPTYKAHFFDNFTFSDNRLIYTPVFNSKMDYYLDKLTVPVEDSLKKEIDYLMQKTSVNKKMEEYMAWFLLVKYGSSEIMGHDALYVYVMNNYLINEKVPWMYPEVKERELKRTATLEPLLLGKVAPNLILFDSSYNSHALYDIKAKYTLVFFWESHCGHCQKEMPEVVKFYDEFHTKYDVEIYGVSGDTSLVKWKNFIIKNNMKWINVNGHLRLGGPGYHTLYDINSTPVMYLLDENKKIIAKRVLTDQIRGLIERREENLKKQKDELPSGSQ